MSLTAEMSYREIWSTLKARSDGTLLKHLKEEDLKELQDLVLSKRKIGGQWRRNGCKDNESSYTATAPHHTQSAPQKQIGNEIQLAITNITDLG